MLELAQPTVEDAPQRTILHVDLDCFFVSVERVLDPSLSQRPVIVGGPSHQRGVVCSASREARSLGVHAAMPMAVATRLCPDAVVLPGRGRLYARAAAAAQRVLREFSPNVERASIDEAYLDLTGTIGEARDRDALAVAASIQRALADRLGLPSSLGIGGSKLIAKVACQRAKPEGIVEVWPGYERAFLAPLPLGDLPGVGPVMAERLALFGLRTIGDLARVDAGLLESMFGVSGRHLSERARGQDDAEIDRVSTPRSISAERTFPVDVHASQPLVAALYELGDVVARRLSEASLHARTLSLKVRTADFRTTTRSRTLAVPTCHASEIAGTACFLLRETHGGAPVRLLGIVASGLVDEPAQPALLEDPEMTRLREEAAHEHLAADPMDDAHAPVAGRRPVMSTQPAPASRRPRLLVRWHSNRPVE